MKSLFLAKVLALGLPLAAAITPLAPAYKQRGVVVANSPPEYTLTVRHHQRAQLWASVATRPVIEVQQVAQHAIATAAPGVTRSRAIHNLLATTYGANLKETSTPMGYHAYWDPVREMWVIVCEDITTYMVDFGRLGSAEVTLTEYH